MDFDETLEDKRMDLGPSKAQFACKDNSPRSTVQLVSHHPGTLSSGTLFDIFCMLYVDDRVFVFESRTNIEKRITPFPTILIGLASKCTLARKKETSNTECVFSAPRFFKHMNTTAHLPHQLHLGHTE